MARVEGTDELKRLFKASLNPIRRKIIAHIGEGKTREELRKELNLSDFQLKFNLDWLIVEGYVVDEDGILKLKDVGCEIAEIKKRKQIKNKK